MKLLLVGHPGAEHVGAHLYEAAKRLNLQVEFFDATRAFGAPRWETKLNWWFRGRCPPRLGVFNEKLFRLYQAFRPDHILSTGIAPVEAKTLKQMSEGGGRSINYLTDDPWNPAHRAPWFMKALPFYSHVFSTRRANLEQLRDLGCPNVSFLPFAYAPEQHFSETPATAEEKTRFETDVVFAGGADRDRVRMIAPLIREGFKVHLYGGYWERYRWTRPCAKGLADPRTLRLAIGSAKVALCLVRRSNRDDNSMRSFEVPAMGGCMLAEGTDTHRGIFGEDGSAAAYFETAQELVEKLRWLLDRDADRKRLTQAGHQMITQGGHTYEDRLRSMLGLR